MVGAQAAANVLTGERYKLISKEAKDYIRGLYGRPPAPIRPDLVAKVLGDEKPNDRRPADLIPPMYEQLKKEAGDLAKNDEDLLTYAMFPGVAADFLKRKYGLV